jgi:hypothetical protein
MRIPTIEFDEKDLLMCGLVMEQLFEKIARAHGEEATRSMFDLYAPRQKDRELAFRKNVQLVLEYRLMDRPSVSKLADRLASENEKLPPKSRWGPRGSTDHYTMKQQIYRVLKQEHYRQIAEGIASRRGQFEPEM